MSKNDGEIKTINIDRIRVTKPQTTSINAVKYFELIRVLLLTGSVCVKYDSSL